MKQRIIRRLVVAALPLLAGCVIEPPPSATPTVMVQEEIKLPPKPKRALSVGIYSCIDTTGQRRPTGSSQELSSAVPMDCTPYLISGVRALTPGYVNLVERQHVDELLRERQLATLALNAAATPQPNGKPYPYVPKRLQMLRVAEVILIGQVVAYDRETRQVTGGIAFGGTGGDATLVTDLVTFSLRAVSVQSGIVLGQTTVTKSITSTKIGGTMSKIWPTRVMNAELGGGANEAVGLALDAAIRASIQQLITAGEHDGWWA